MKLVWCLSCGDIGPPEPSGAVTSCASGCTLFRWTDPLAGTLEVAHAERRARVLGLHNAVLRAVAAAAASETALRDATFVELHAQIEREAEGYLFHGDRRGCWAVVIAPGESNDTRWVEREELAREVLP